MCWSIQIINFFDSFIEVFLGDRVHHSYHIYCKKYHCQPIHCGSTLIMILLFNPLMASRFKSLSYVVQRHSVCVVVFLLFRMRHSLLIHIFFHFLFAWLTRIPQTHTHTYATRSCTHAHSQLNINRLILLMTICIIDSQCKLSF